MKLCWSQKVWDMMVLKYPRYAKEFDGYKYFGGHYVVILPMRGEV